MKSEYLLLLPIESFLVGDTHKPGEPLPLHCTIIYWFQLGYGHTLEEITTSLQGIASMEYFEDVILVSKEPALFGPENDVPVHILERREHLTLLHTLVFTLLATVRSLPSELKWAGAGYSPHVTSTDQEFLPGTEHHPRELVLIERDENKLRKVIATFPLEK